MKKLNWAMIGGGEGSQIGLAHRVGAVLDGRYQLAASALDIDPQRGRDYGIRLGVEPSRAYGTWQEMLASEVDQPDRLDLVTVATPNATHHEITKAFLEGGFHVLCEKPMTVDPAQARDLVAVSQTTGKLCAVNFGYSGYPLVRHMMAAVRRGDLGRIRVVHAEFAGGFMADAADADNPRVRWRFDPAQAGVSAVTGDAGIHALHLACFVTGQQVTSVSADFAHGIAGRQLEDDALIAFRMNGGAIGRLWTSGLAIGHAHGLTLEVFGENGGFSWQQEQPNQLRWTPLNQPTQILERGTVGLSPDADRASRITVGHAEGMPLAFANIYRDLADMIAADNAGTAADPLAANYPTAADGLHSIETVFAAVASAKNGSKWVEVVAN